MANNKQEQTLPDDALLQMLLSLVEEDGIEIAVSFTVNGAVVAGNLIGANAYYDGIIHSSTALQDSTLSKIIAKKFTDMKEAYVKQKQKDKENGGHPPTFIHLKNATYFSNNGKSNSITWWRGRISSIDAVSFDDFA